MSWLESLIHYYHYNHRNLPLQNWSKMYLAQLSLESYLHDEAQSLKINENSNLIKNQIEKIIGGNKFLALGLLYCKKFVNYYTENITQEKSTIRLS